MRRIKLKELEENVEKATLEDKLTTEVDEVLASESLESSKKNAKKLLNHDRSQGEPSISQV